jgi:alpha-mannosidase
MTRTGSFDVHLVSHTHWDREWYLTAGRFRQRLVALIDDLLEQPLAAGSFLLDGQTVVLDDYLAVRPDREHALRERLQSGALEAGPWYVLADELIPSGEALVRNLLAGRAILSRFGAQSPCVLYSPDAFGHAAALPSLAEGFGLPLAILWRGLGGECWPPGDTFRWRSPGGDEVLVHHLPQSGYEMAANIPVAPDESRAWWQRTRAELAARAKLDVLLLLNGADHHARQPDLEQAALALEPAAAPDTVHRSSLRAFALAVVQRARAAELPEIAGELRASYGYTWTLQGTFSTRAHQKRHNALVERLLVRDAEPWAALAWRYGHASRAHLMRAAWRTLLLCHPHDTLCGCSIDEVARAMSARLEDVEAQGAGVRDDALLDLMGHDRIAARARRTRWRPVVVLRNACARPRGGIAELEVAIERERVPVGPGSASKAGPSSAPVAGFTFEDAGIGYQILERYERHDRVDSPAHYPDNALVDSWRVMAWVPPVRGYGLLAIGVRPKTTEHAGQRPPPMPPSVPVATAGPNWIDNGILRLTVSETGQVSLEVTASGRRIASLLGFESVGDRGDLYTSSPVGEPLFHSRFRGAVLVHKGPLRAQLNAAWEMDLPRSTSRTARSLERVTIPVEASFMLDAGAPFVRCHISGENLACDHRLRVVLRTGIVDGSVHADAAFGPVVRAPIAISDAAERMERAPATAPLARYVTISSAADGVTLISDGLAEYEASPDGALAVTLVRAVGALSRNDLPERPGHAGWPVPTPDAQCLGPFACEVALMPHGPRDADTIDAVERAADDVLLPLTGATLRSALDVPPPTLGVELEGRALAFSTCKQSEDGEWLVLRCVNLDAHPVEGRWRLGLPVREARRARMDETPAESLPVTGTGIAFVAGPRAVVTILAR